MSKVFWLSRLNGLCDAFEAAWRSGTSPAIEEFLDQVSESDRPELLQELLALELAYRRKRGIDLDPTECLERFPDQRDAVARAFAGAGGRPGDDRTGHASSALPAATRIGNYELLEEIARGGMGVVYKAQQVNLNRTVAVKMILSGEFAGRQEIDRFRVEAEAAAHLRHPHIVSIYEIGEERGRAYFSMEYVEGQDLHAALQNGPLPPRDAAQMMRLTAEAVQYAHARGVIHRDLKPRNILLDQEGRPHVTDFGLARREGSNQNLTVTGQVLGTPGFMPPEQARNCADEIGPRSDVYSLGALFYVSLVGRPPFQAANAVETLQQVVSADPVPLRLLNPGVPRDLETICLKCLSKEPRERYATAQDLADDLGRYLRLEPIVSRPVGPAGRAWRWCRRRPALATLSGVVVAAVLTIAYAFFAYDRSLAKFNNELSELNADLAATAASARDLQRLAEDTQRQTQDALYASDISRAAIAWGEGDARGVMELLERHMPASGQPDRRGFEWWYLRRQASQAERVVLEVGSPVYYLCFSPDSRLLAAAGKDSIVRLIDPETYEVEQEIATKQIEVNGVAFSPDGRNLATAGDDGTIRVWDLQDKFEGAKFERLKIAAHPGKAYQVVFTPDGRRLVSCGDDPIIRVFDVESGAIIQSLAKHEDDVQSLALAPDGRSLASTSSDSSVMVWDLERGRQTFFNTSTRNVGPLVFLADRGLLLIGNEGGNVQSISMLRNIEVGLARHFDRIGALAIHPNGKLLAVGDGAGSLRLWELGLQGELTAGSFQPWQAHRGNVRTLLWSRNGSRLFSAGDDGKIMSWNVAATQRRGPRSFAFDYVDSFCLIPHSRQLVTGGGDSSRVVLWDWTTGTRVETLDDHYVDDVAVAPDGTSIAGLRREGVLTLYSVAGIGKRPAAQSARSHWRPDGEMKRLWFSPDSQMLAVSLWKKGSSENVNENSLWLLRWPDCQPAIRLPLEDARLAAFAPNGTRLAVHAKGQLTMWDLAEAKVIWNVPEPDVTRLVFSPDGSLVVTGGVSRLVIVREAMDGSTRFRLNSHRSFIRSIAFSPDGRTLATSAHGAVKFWHVATGQEFFELPRANAYSRCAEFAADGRHLLWHVHVDPAADDEIVVFDATENDDE